MSTLNARVAAADPAEMVALVVRAKQAPLLRAYAHKLRREDLEDCFSQAALELVMRARVGARFANRTHIARTLEQRFVSRIIDRRRAIEGRSEGQRSFERALGAAAFAGGEDAYDPKADIERLVLLRGELRDVSRFAAELSEDQRLVLACQVGMQMSCAEFCARFGWSHERFRKVAQRARLRLRRLIDEQGAESAPRRSPSAPQRSQSALQRSQSALQRSQSAPQQSPSAPKRSHAAPRSPSASQ